MKRKPGHATVVAYVALFVALGGTALAASGQIGAKGLKRMVVREEVRRVPANASQDFWQVIARCKRKEQFVSGSGGWVGDDGPLAEKPLVTSALAIRNELEGPAVGYEVRGYNPPGLANELVAQALCLPK